MGFEQRHSHIILYEYTGRVNLEATAISNPQSKTNLAVVRVQLYTKLIIPYYSLCYTKSNISIYIFYIEKKRETTHLNIRSLFNISKPHLMVLYAPLVRVKKGRSLLWKVQYQVAKVLASIMSVIPVMKNIVQKNPRKLATKKHIVS